MKYIGAISDADILINLAKVDKLNLLDKLFKKIVIPQYVFDVEIKKNAGRYYNVILQAIRKEDSIFEVVDRKKDSVINRLSRETIEEKKVLIGPGESECAGYAKALRIPIIISDNYTEFKWLDEYITLTHKNLLALCVYHEYLTKQQAEEIYTSINRNLTRPSTNTFKDHFKRSLKDFHTKEWDKFLGINNY